MESDAINAVAWTPVTMKRESNEVRIVFSIPGGRTNYLRGNYNRRSIEFKLIDHSRATRKHLGFWSSSIQNWIYKLETLEDRKGGNKLAITNALAGRNLGMVLLAIWLILTGLLPLLSIRVSPTVNTVLAVLAIVAGLLILLRR